MFNPNSSPKDIKEADLKGFKALLKNDFEATEKAARNHSERCCNCDGNVVWFKVALLPGQYNAGQRTWNQIGGGLPMPGYLSNPFAPGSLDLEWSYAIPCARP